MADLYHVEAIWDPEAGVWVSESDVPGLVIEADSLAEFESLVQELVPELLADNDGKAANASIELTSRRTFELTEA